MAQARIAREGNMPALAFQYAQDAKHYRGADVSDVIEAAVASGCACLNNHAPALLQRRIWAPMIVQRETVPTDSEGEE